MKVKKKKYEDISPIEFLLFREKFKIKRYRKQIKRNHDEKEILLNLALKKIAEKEKDDFISIGYRKRKIVI